VTAGNGQLGSSLIGGAHVFGEERGAVVEQDWPDLEAVGQTHLEFCSGLAVNDLDELKSALAVAGARLDRKALQEANASVMNAVRFLSAIGRPNECDPLQTYVFAWSVAESAAGAGLPTDGPLFRASADLAAARLHEAALGELAEQNLFGAQALAGEIFGIGNIIDDYYWQTVAVATELMAVYAEHDDFYSQPFGATPESLRLDPATVAAKARGREFVARARDQYRGDVERMSLLTIYERLFADDGAD
jgi:hypothetical protein